jgi:hypothetical protein
MTETAEQVTTAIPELTLEHKNTLLLQHRAILALQVNMNAAEKELSKLTAQFNDSLQAITTDIKLDVTKYAPDLEHMTIVART